MEKLGGEKSNNGSETCSTPPPAKKVLVKVVEMSDDMLEQAVDIAATAFEKHRVKDDVAEYIKKMFDELHGPFWHCIVGNFDCCVSHEENKSVCFSMEETTELLYKSGTIGLNDMAQ